MNAPPAFDKIRRALRAARRRLMWRVTVVATGWFLAAVSVSLLVATLLAGWGLSGAAWRWVLLAGIGIVGALTMWRNAWRPARRYRGDEAVASALEDALPSLQDGLLACVQFEREWGQDLQAPGLVGALSERVAARLSKADLRTLISMGAARRPWKAVGAAGLVWAAASFTGPRVLERGLASLFPSPRTTDGRSIETGPLVGDLQIELIFPDHIGRAPQVIPNAIGDIEAPKGTRARIKATTVERARRVVVHLGDAELLLSLSADGREVSGEFVVQENTKWFFQLDDMNGDRLVENVERRIRVQPDRIPEVELLLPAEDLELDDLRSLTVRWQASDDHGLSRVNVVIGLASDPDNAERLGQEGLKGRSGQGVDDIDLRLVQAQPGDRLAVYVEAFDNNGVDGPQRGVSKTRYVVVHSPQAKHYALTDSLRELIELLLGGLAHRLEVDWHAPGAALPETIASLQASSQKAAMAMAKVVEQMADDPLTPEEVRLALAGRLGSLESSIRLEAEGAERLEGQLTEHLKPAINRVQKASEAAIEQLEQAVILVEAMVARLALEDMAALTDEIQQARENLKELIKAYRDNPSEQLKKRIMRDIQRLRQRMKEIKERMARLSQKLPEEFLNLDGLKKDDVAKGLEKSTDQLDALEKMLEEGKIDEALAALDEMEKALDELDKSLNEDMQSLHEESNPQMQKAISELMDQTRDVMKQQAKIAAETEAAAKAEAERTQKILKEELAEQLAGVKEKANQLEAQAGAVNPRHLPSFAEDELAHLGQRVGDLQRALGREQLREALEMSERALDHVEALKRFARHDPRAEENQAHLEKGRGLARELTKDLAKLLEDAQQRQAKARQPGSPEFDENQRLGEKQRQVAQSAGKLIKRMQSAAKKVPQLGDKPMQQAQRAQQSMEQAGQQLAEQRPGGARPGQQQAMSELRNLMEGLKKSNQPSKADRGRSRRTRQQRVEIPDADDHDAPAAFRKDLLEAMKEKPAEAYREQVKRYYESLVR